MDLHPQHSSLFTTFDFSSLEKEEFREDLIVFIFLVVNIICAMVISRPMLMSDCGSPYIGPSRLVVSHCYNHRASFSQPCSFCFCPPGCSVQGHAMQLTTTNFPDISFSITVHGWFSSLYYILLMLTYCGKPSEQFLQSHFPCTEGRRSL